VGCTGMARHTLGPAQQGYMYCVKKPFASAAPHRSVARRSQPRLARAPPGLLPLLAAGLPLVASPSRRRRGVEWPVPYVSAPAPCVSGSPPRLVSRWPALPRQPASRPPPDCPFADLLQPSAGEKSIPSALPLWPFVPLVFSKIPNPNFTVI